jgi:hypothetical protein
VEKLEGAMKRGVEERVIVKNYGKDGSPFWNRIQVTPIRASNLTVVLYAMVMYEVRKLISLP